MENSSQLSDFVSEEAAKGCSRSFYHISGFHVCELESGGYRVLSHKEYSETKESGRKVANCPQKGSNQLEEGLKEVLDFFK